MHLPQNITRLLPFLRWPRPTWTSLKGDAWAGITVGLVLIPQALAYATLAGMPPYTGLYAALLPSIVGMLWGSSALLAVGPVALTSLVAFGGLASMAEPGSSQWVALSIWLALYSGLIQFALGAFRLGRIASLVSQPVVIGFINAAAVIIIMSQLPALLGIDLSLDYPGGVMDRWREAPAALITTAFGGGAMLLLLGFKRFLPKLPGILIVTVGGIAASALLGYAEAGGAVVGAIPSGLPLLALPSAISFESHQQLWPAALILALISFTEAMSSCRVLARKKNEQWDENQELIGQGLAKITSGFSGAFPVSGSFSRSALNLYAGATSAWSTLFSAVCVLISLLFLTDYLYPLPRSVLAAIIIVPVFSLINFSAIRRLFTISRNDGTIAVVTFVVTLMSLPHLYWGVAAGVSLSAATLLYRRTQPRVIEVGQHADGSLRERRRFGLPRLAPDVFAVRIDSALNFLSAAALERYVTTCCREDRQIKRVLLSAGSINDIDASGVEMLESLRAALRMDGVEFYICALKKQVSEVLVRAAFIESIGSQHVFATDHEAASAFLGPNPAG